MVVTRTPIDPILAARQTDFVARRLWYTGHLRHAPTSHTLYTFRMLPRFTDAEAHARRGCGGGGSAVGQGAEGLARRIESAAAAGGGRVGGDGAGTHVATHSCCNQDMSCHFYQRNLKHRPRSNTRARIALCSSPTTYLHRKLHAHCPLAGPNHCPKHPDLVDVHTGA